MWWGQWRERPRKKRMDQTSVSAWGRREGREGGKEGRSRYKAGLQDQESVGVGFENAQDVITGLLLATPHVLLDPHPTHCLNLTTDYPPSLPPSLPPSFPPSLPPSFLPPSFPSSSQCIMMTSYKRPKTTETLPTSGMGTTFLILKPTSQDSCRTAAYLHLTTLPSSTP